MPDSRPDLYAHAFRETANPGIITDTEFVITDANDALLSMFGYEREDLIGATPLQLINDDGVFDDVIAALSADESWVGDFEATTKDGRLVYGRGSATPLIVDGECEGYVAVFTDMTRHRRYQESLRILNRVLRHNLRNDANVALGHLERVSEQIDDPALAASFDTAASRIEDMLDRARTTRRFSGILSDTETSSLKPVDLAAAIGQALEDVRTAGVSVDVPDASEPIDVLADDMLVPALQAVVENAIEHNDKETPRVDIGVTTDDGEVVLSIADNGPGIERSRRDRVLGREEHTDVDHGEGLSLFFVDQLMELYGGEVTVRANGDEGTVFDLRFRRPDAAADDGADPVADPDPEPGPDESGSGDPADDAGAAAPDDARSSTFAADATGSSVTPERLTGDIDGFPRIVDAIEDDQPHHVLRLRRDDPLHTDGTADVPLRGTAAAVLTDDAVRVVVDGGAGGTWTLPYADLAAVGRRDDSVVLDTTAGRFSLRLPRSTEERDHVAAALAFLERKLRD